VFGVATTTTTRRKRATKKATTIYSRGAQFLAENLREKILPNKERSKVEYNFMILNCQLSMKDLED
jgi:hypothetical protein